MAELIWQNQDLNDLITRLITVNEEIRESLVPLMVEAMAEAETMMKTYVETAITKTGLERAAGHSKRARTIDSGRDPGRIETGRMINAIESTVVSDGDLVIGSWGWLNGLDADTLYFLYQENGTGTLPAMHALLQSFIQIREQVKFMVSGIPYRIEELR